MRRLLGVEYSKILTLFGRRREIMNNVKLKVCVFKKKNF